MGIVWTIVIGFLAGLIARAVKPGDDNLGIIMTTLLGIGGALLGGFLGRAFGIYEPTEVAGFVASVVGAVLILFIASFFGKKRIGHGGPHRV